VAVEHGGNPLGECVDVVVNVLWRAEGERGEGLVSDLGV
jgi:hypothetical protein